MKRYKIKHSESKKAWNIVGVLAGGKYKIARIPYCVCGDEKIDSINQLEAYEHALIMCDALNSKKDKSIPKVEKSKDSFFNVCGNCLKVLGQNNNAKCNCLKQITELQEPIQEPLDSIFYKAQITDKLNEVIRTVNKLLTM